MSEPEQDAPLPATHGPIEIYRVERDEQDTNVEWHIFIFADGWQLHIHTDRPVIIVEPERH